MLHILVRDYILPCSLSLGKEYRHIMLSVCACLQEDSVLNLKKTKTLFIQRQTEYEKVKESNQRMDSEASSSQQSVSSSKADKKKKLEDDACFKVSHLFFDCFT